MVASGGHRGEFLSNVPHVSGFYPLLLRSKNGEKTLRVRTNLKGQKADSLFLSPFQKPSDSLGDLHKLLPFLLFLLRLEFGFFQFLPSLL